MTKQPASFQLPFETIRTIKVITDSLMKSRNWVVEQAVYGFGCKVDNFLAIEEDFREYLKVKRNLWKDELLGEQLRYHMRQGFILKNSIKKIIEMIQSGVNKQHILKVVTLYEKLARDFEYQDILNDIKKGITGNMNLDTSKIILRLEASRNSKQKKVLA